jgi:hypothetical protein
MSSHGGGRGSQPQPPKVTTTCPLSFRLSAGFKIKLHAPRASGREERRAGHSSGLAYPLVSTTDRLTKGLDR